MEYKALHFLTLFSLLLVNVFYFNVYAQVPGGVTAGLQIWYDASDINGDNDFTNNPADETNITTWVDKSGNGNDATVIAGKNPGTMDSDAAELVNGNPFVKFNKIARRQGSMYDTGVDIRSGSMEDMTLFIVYKPKTVIGGNILAEGVIEKRGRSVKTMNRSSDER